MTTPSARGAYVTPRWATRRDYSPEDNAFVRVEERVVHILRCWRCDKENQDGDGWRQHFDTLADLAEWLGTSDAEGQGWVLGDVKDSDLRYLVCNDCWTYDWSTEDEFGNVKRYILPAQKPD